jgi:hypothetical protein
MGDVSVSFFSQWILGIKPSLNCLKGTWEQCYRYDCLIQATGKHGRYNLKLNIAMDIFLLEIMEIDMRYCKVCHKEKCTCACGPTRLRWWNW